MDIYQTVPDASDFIQLFKSIPSGIIFFDNYDKIIAANETAGEIFHLSADQMSGRKLQELGWEITGMDKSELQAEGYPNNLASETGEVITNYVISIHKINEGLSKWIRVDSIPLKNGEGTHDGRVCSVFRDISEDILSKRRIQQSEQQLNTLINNVSGVVYRCRADENPTMLFLSNQFIRMTGYPKDDFLNNRIRAFSDIIHPDDRERVKNDILQAVEKRECYEVDYRIITSGNEIKYVKDRGKGTTDDDNTLFEGLIVDVTKKHKYESELASSEKRYRELFEDHPAVKLIIDPETGDIVNANKAASDYYGYTVKELRTMNMREIDYSEQGNYDLKVEEIRRENLLHFQVRNRLKDGSVRSVEVYTSFLNWDNRKLLYTIVFDITEKEKIRQDLIIAKERAEEGDRLKSAFLATISHELRTPLNSVLGFSDLIRSVTEEEETKKYAGLINKSGNELLEIIEDIFSIAFYGPENVKIRLTSFKLSSIFKQLKNYARKILFNYGKDDKIELVFSVPYNLLRKIVRSDKGKIVQVMSNLIKNAVKFTERGFIELGIEEYDSTLSFYIKDTGIGIPEDKQGIIFDFFRQVDDTYSRKFGGVGIGLAISKRIAEVLKGKITVESAPGEGSVCYFTIPCELHDKEIIPGRSMNKAIPDLTGHSVLIAEDDRTNMLLIMELLKPTGILINTAVNGREAVDFIKAGNKPDFVLMDLKMPFLDGFQATGLIHETNPGIPVIAITALAFQDDNQKALDAGCTDVIMKPVKRDMFYSRIKKIFN